MNNNFEPNRSKKRFSAYCRKMVVVYNEPIIHNYDRYFPRSLKNGDFLYGLFNSDHELMVVAENFPSARQLLKKSGSQFWTEFKMDKEGIFYHFENKLKLKFAKSP